MFDRERILRLAERYAERDKLADALREYGKLLEADPTDLSILHQMARLELRLGAHAEAARTFARIGERLVAKGWKLAAIYRHRRLLELSESLSAEERAIHRGAAARLERLRAEVADARKRAAPFDEAAQALERAGDPDAIEILVKMIAIAPDNPVFHARLAEAYCRQDRIDDALPVFRSAAQALMELDRRTDALRVLERILHFRVEADDSRLAAALYLERGEPNDAARAVGRLQPCIALDPENLDALGLLARAFDAMGQAARATQVRIEMARVAREAGETDLFRDLLSVLMRAAADDPAVRALSQVPVSTSAPTVSVRTTQVSFSEEDLAKLEGLLAETRSHADASVLDDLSFEELSDVWVMPVLSKQARRALEDAASFTALRLFGKAEYVLRRGMEDDPLCAELREALRNALRSNGDVDGFVAETLALADLYRQRRYFDRAAKLVDEALDLDPSNEQARRAAAELGNLGHPDAI